MGANYTPIINPTSQLGSFRFWVQKVLPLVYDDSLSYYELLCKVVNYINEIIKNADATNENIHNLYDAYEKLQSYVNNYFVSLDVSDEVDKKLDEMVQDGTLEQLVGDAIYSKGDIVLISDSYGNPESSGGTSWEQFVKQYMSDRNVLAYYKGGCGFAWWADGVHGKANEYYFPNFVSTIPGSETVKDVLMLCGANDGNLMHSGYTDDAIETGIAETAAILKEKFPNAKISLGFVGRYKVPGRDKYYYEACEAYKRCTKYGVCFAENFQYVLHNRNLLEDSDVHPNAEGSKRIAHYAVEYLLSGHVDVTDVYTSTLGDKFFAIVTVNNGITNLNAHSQNSLGVMVTIGTAIAFDDVLNMGNIELPVFKPIGDYGAVGCPGSVYASYRDSTGGSLTGYFYMVQNGLYFQVGDLPDTTQICGAVYYRGLNITCPTMFC